MRWQDGIAVLGWELDTTPVRVDLDPDCQQVRTVLGTRITQEIDVLSITASSMDESAEISARFVWGVEPSGIDGIEPSGSCE